MVNGTDIRMGNWLLVVYASEKPNSLVINYQPKAIEPGDLCALNTCLPIALTNAVLEKCGFIYDEGMWCKYQSVEEGRVLVLQRSGNEGWFVEGVAIKTAPRYLHQLQNLFYALTGKELKVALETYHVFDPSSVIL
jgi:hypothetical protein